MKFRICINRKLKQEIDWRACQGKPISWHWLRKWTQSGYDADQIAKYAVSKGAEIEFEGKRYKKWL